MVKFAILLISCVVDNHSLEDFDDLFDISLRKKEVCKCIYLLLVASITVAES